MIIKTVLSTGLLICFNSHVIAEPNATIEDAWQKVEACNYNKKKQKSEFLDDVNSASRKLSSYHAKVAMNKNLGYSELRKELSYLLAPMIPAVKKSLINDMLNCRKELAFALLTVNLSTTKGSAAKWYSCVNKTFPIDTQINKKALKVKYCIERVSAL